MLHDDSDSLDRDVTQAAAQRREAWRRRALMSIVMKHRCI